MYIHVAQEGLCLILKEKKMNNENSFEFEIKTWNRVDKIIDTVDKMKECKSRNDQSVASIQTTENTRIRVTQKKN